MKAPKEIRSIRTRRSLQPKAAKWRRPNSPRGRVLADKYVIEHAIGGGGPVGAPRPDVVERFLREARLAARIKNEHAVKVHDVDASPSGVPYMVMEYLEGRSRVAISSRSSPSRRCPSTSRSTP
jgi:serine/threonine protein kinase